MDKEILRCKSVLRDFDLDILRGTCFLSDEIIAFYFSYLSSSCKTDDIMLVKPSVSLWIANCHDDDVVQDFVESCMLSSKRLVLFAVNDSDGGDCGNHWSTLVYDRSKNAFLHYDSMEGVNEFHARKLYEVVKEFTGEGGGGVLQPSGTLKKQKTKKRNGQSGAKPLGGGKSASVAPDLPVGLPIFEECKTPQQ